MKVSEMECRPYYDKALGKITGASFGYGGYDGVMLFGLDLTFEGQGWGVGDFKGTWADPPSEYAQWTVEDQNKAFLEAALLLKDTLKLAKKKSVEELVGTPVEVTFENNKIKSWRILTEVI